MMEGLCRWNLFEIEWPVCTEWERPRPIASSWRRDVGKADPRFFPGAFRAANWLPKVDNDIFSNHFLNFGRIFYTVSMLWFWWSSSSRSMREIGATGGRAKLAGARQNAVQNIPPFQGTFARTIIFISIIVVLTPLWCLYFEYPITLWECLAKKTLDHSLILPS